MSMKRILAVFLIFCLIHIPLYDVPDRHEDAQITNFVHHVSYTQTAYPDSNTGKEICNIRCFVRESIIFFEIAKFAYEIAKAHVYIWQLPRGNIGGIMMKAN